MPRITRRLFVLGLGGTVLPGLAADGPQPRVVVVGAGLAGLAAAHDLAAAGIDVRVAEQSSRAGGRVKTVRGVFADDAWVDVGGQSTGEGYANFFDFAARYGLEMVPRQRPAGRSDVLLDLRGELYSGAALRAAPETWPLALNEAEKPLAPARLLGHYLRAAATAIGTAERVLDPAYAHYDELSLLEFLEREGASAAAIRMIDKSLNYNNLATVSALGALRDAVRLLQGGGGPTFNVATGNASLPERMAGALGDRIRYRCRLRSLRYSTNEAQLQIETARGNEVWEADFAVLAVPFTALRRVRFDTALPAARRAAVKRLPYTQVAQTYVQSRERFWQQHGTVAAVYSDGPLERLFDASTTLNTGRGLLVNWINGDGTGALAGASAEEQAEFTLAEMARIWPGCRETVEATYANNWGNSYAEGAYAHYAPGQMTAYAAEIGRPIGCLHFAGEHTELVAPGMEGALTSGRRAAGEILERIRAAA